MEKELGWDWNYTGLAVKELFFFQGPHHHLLNSYNTRWGTTPLRLCLPPDRDECAGFRCDSIQNERRTKKRAKTNSFCHCATRRNKFNGRPLEIENGRNGGPWATLGLLTSARVLVALLHRKMKLPKHINISAPLRIFHNPFPTNIFLLSRRWKRAGGIKKNDRKEGRNKNKSEN